MRLITKSPQIKALPEPYMLVMLAMVLAAPWISALWGLFGPSGDQWSQLRSTVVPVYLQNTLLIALGVTLFSTVLGLLPALLLHRFSFSGARILPLFLVLPLAVPAYINGLSYHALFDYASPLYVFLREHFGLQYGPYLFFNLHSISGAIIIFSLSYYPYVFLLTYVSLLHFDHAKYEMAWLLQAGQWQIFRSLLWPHLRPGLMAGLALVLMETLNDYGLVRFFGVETFTTGIFNAWFVLRDGPAAFRLASMLLLFAFLLLLAERAQRRQIEERKRSLDTMVRKIQLKGFSALVVFSLAALPFLLGFLLPVANLIFLFTQALSSIVRYDFLLLTFNSLWLALRVGFISSLVALLILYLRHRFKSRLSEPIILFSTVGYAIPGAVIATGVLILLQLFRGNTLLDYWLGFLMHSTTVVLVYAYVTRFVTASWNSLSAGFSALGNNQLEAACLLGAPGWQVFGQVVWPGIRPALLAGFIIVSMDVLKELPLTLLLRPFNYDTLAIRAFEYASDERFAEASPYALLVVAAGLLPLWLMRKQKLLV